MKEKTDDKESSSGETEVVADNQQNDQLNDALNVTVENEIVANDEVAAPQKQKLENLDDVLNLKNYDKLE